MTILPVTANGQMTGKKGFLIGTFDRQFARLGSPDVKLVS